MNLIEFLKYLHDDGFDRETLSTFERDYGLMVQENSDLEWSNENTLEEWVEIFETLAEEFDEE
jgi:hypothetical protein